MLFFLSFCLHYTYMYVLNSGFQTFFKKIKQRSPNNFFNASLSPYKIDINRHKQQVDFLLYQCDGYSSFFAITSAMLAPVWTTQPANCESHRTGFELLASWQVAPKMQILTQMLLGIRTFKIIFETSR